MLNLVAITGVTEVDESKGLKCLVQTPAGLEQAVVSCNAEYHRAAGAVFEYVNKSILDHQKSLAENDKKIRFLH